MDLWVRSQDKMDLVRIKDFHIEETPSSEIVAIIGYYYDKSYTNLGYYSNKKRALEVLNEIQDLLTPIIVSTNSSDEDGKLLKENLKGKTYITTKNNADIHWLTNTYVYQMPEE